MTRRYRRRQPARRQRQRSDMLELQTTLPTAQGPQRQSAANVLALQRTVGNAATQQLLQRWNKGVVPTGQQPSGSVVIGGSQSAPVKPTFDPIKPDKLTSMNIRGGLFKNRKKIKKPIKSGQAVMDNLDQTTVSVISSEEYASQWQGAANNIAAAAQTGNVFGLQTALQEFLGVIMPYIKLAKMAVQIPMKIYKLHKRREELDALRKAYKSAKVKGQSGDTSAQAVAEAARYGYQKVRRHFAEGIAKVVIKIAKFATLLTDIITGGTAILFTSISKLLTSTSSLIMMSVASIKSIYKHVKDTKGVNRRMNAETLINEAMNNQPDAMHLMYKLKIGKKLYFQQQGISLGKTAKLKRFAKGKKEPPFFKNNERGYYVWLKSLKTTDEWTKLREELAAKLRSTSFKPFALGR